MALQKKFQPVKTEWVNYVAAVLMKFLGKVVDIQPYH